jgi:hypothetical protein
MWSHSRSPGNGPTGWFRPAITGTGVGKVTGVGDGTSVGVTSGNGVAVLEGKAVGTSVLVGTAVGIGVRAGRKVGTTEMGVAVGVTACEVNIASGEPVDVPNTVGLDDGPQATATNKKTTKNNSG